MVAKRRSSVRDLTTFEFAVGKRGQTVQLGEQKVRGGGGKPCVRREPGTEDGADIGGIGSWVCAACGGTRGTRAVLVAGSSELGSKQTSLVVATPVGRQPWGRVISANRLLRSLLTRKA